MGLRKMSGTSKFSDTFVGLGSASMGTTLFSIAWWTNEGLPLVALFLSALLSLAGIAVAVSRLWLNIIEIKDKRAARRREECYDERS